MEELITQLVADFHESELPPLVPRTARVPEIAGMANVVIGMRRCGKTYFLYQQLAQLLRNGTPKPRLLYINFEDERLGELRADQLHLVTDVFFRLFPDNRQQTAWLFFDEIQVVPGWERYVRRLLDTERVRVVLSGSSSKLLSREIATSMRGRAVETLLLPFSFAEFLTAEQTPAPPEPSLVGKAQRSTLENRLATYLEVGGFPAVQGLGLLDRRQVLQSYAEVAMFRDVVERHSVSNIVLLKQLVRQLLCSPACPFSAGKFFRDCKSQGLSCAKNTVLDYLDHLTDCFLVFPVEMHSESERQRQTNPTKIYPVDTGLAAAFRVPGREPRGHLLETAVMLELVRRGASLSYVRTGAGYEVDFHVRPPDGPPELVQVCADLSAPETLARELRALADAASELGVSDATIVTMTDEATHKIEGLTVHVAPAWRWLLPGRAGSQPAPTPEA